MFFWRWGSMKTPHVPVCGLASDGSRPSRKSTSRSRRSPRPSRGYAGLVLRGQLRMEHDLTARYDTLSVWVLQNRFLEFPLETGV
jgi:hypothetical protein